MITRKGTPLVHKGDIVEVGDVLVTGTLEILDDGGGVMAQHRVQADADIILERTYEYKDSLPASYIERNYIKEKNPLFCSIVRLSFSDFSSRKTGKYGSYYDEKPMSFIF